MCPLCIGTAALLATGGTSAGGFVLILLRKPFRRRRTTTSLQIPAGANNSIAQSVKSDDVKTLD